MNNIYPGEFQKNDKVPVPLDGLKELTQTLDDDVRIAFERLLEFKTDFDIRVFVRIVYSGIEGYLYFLRQMCLQKYEINPKLYAPHEVMALQEVRANINNTGVVDVKDEFMQFEKSFRFTIRYAFIDGNGILNVDFNSSGWQMLLKGQDVRNRITHPKDAKRMNITKDDYIAVMEGYLWFREIMDCQFKQSLAALKIEYDKLNELLINAKKST